eukprot:gene5839-5906_t
MNELGSGEWLNPPVSANLNAEGLAVLAKGESDFWQKTSYGFTHLSGHALLNPFPQDSAIEVSWILNYTKQFDQAGLIAYSDDENWIKGGVEFADGFPQLGAVVTIQKSDWSVAPVTDWMNREWRLVRLAPLDPSRNWRVGLFCASPTQAGLEILFTSLRWTDADKALH